MNKVNSLFDVIGPVMVGPSSSHTAGVAKLARIAESVAGERITEVTFLLHGSFQTTYKGHGSDRALLAGIMGLGPSDPRLVDAYRLADEAGLKYEFVKKDLGAVHPNTIKVVMTGESGNVTELTGASVGGGEVLISNLNGFEVNFGGNYYTLVIIHEDRPGVVTAVAGELAKEGVNLATMSLSRAARGMEATLIMELDTEPSPAAISRIGEIPHVSKVLFYKPEKA